MYSDLGVGYGLIFLGPDLLDSTHLDPNKYCKTFKYAMGPDI